MENSSKALIIAGAVLLAILLIILGVLLFKNSNGIIMHVSNTANAIKRGEGLSVEALKDLLKSSEKDIFNQYKGKQNGSNIRMLLEAVRKNNATDKEHQIVVISGSIGSFGGTFSFKEDDIDDSEEYMVSFVHAGENDEYAKKVLNENDYSYYTGGTSLMEGNSYGKTEKGYLFIIYISR